MRGLQRTLRGLQDACRDANTAARTALGLSALDAPRDADEGSENLFVQAHCDQLGSLVDLMTSKLKVPSLRLTFPTASLWQCLTRCLWLDGRLEVRSPIWQLLGLYSAMQPGSINRACCLQHIVCPSFVMCQTQ